MKQKETNVWKKLLLNLSPRGFRLFRNERYKGPIVTRGVITKAWADCGLADGAGDLIGYRIVEITSDMVGKKLAVFTSIETKTRNGDIRDKQVDFASRIRQDGGISVIFRDGENYEDIR